MARCHVILFLIVSLIIIFGVTALYFMGYYLYEQYQKEVVLVLEKNNGNNLIVFSTEEVPTFIQFPPKIYEMPEVLALDQNNFTSIVKKYDYP